MDQRMDQRTKQTSLRRVNCGGVNGQPPGGWASGEVSRAATLTHADWLGRRVKAGYIWITLHLTPPRPTRLRAHSPVRSIRPFFGPFTGPLVHSLVHWSIHWSIHHSPHGVITRRVHSRHPVSKAPLTHQCFNRMTVYTIACVYHSEAHNLLKVECVQTSEVSRRMNGRMDR